MEAGDERDGEEALGVHLPPQEEVTFQIVEAEVVLTAGHKTGRTEQDLLRIHLTNYVDLCASTPEDIMQNIYTFIPLIFLFIKLSMTNTS